MTGTDVITDRARELLDDTSAVPADQRWVDAVLLNFLNDGVRTIVTFRPEVLLSAGYTLGALTELTAIGDTISIDDRYRDALAHYVAGQALASDAQDRRDLARSQSHFRLFTTKSQVPLDIGAVAGR